MTSKLQKEDCYSAVNSPSIRATRTNGICVESTQQNERKKLLIFASSPSSQSVISALFPKDVEHPRDDGTLDGVDPRPRPLFCSLAVGGQSEDGIGRGARGGGRFGRYGRLFVGGRTGPILLQSAARWMPATGHLRVPEGAAAGRSIARLLVSLLFLLFFHFSSLAGHVSRV